MDIKQKLLNIARRWTRIRLRNRVIIVSVFVFFAGYGLLFGISKSVVYAFSGADCARQLTLFPNTMKQVGESGFTVEYKDKIDINGFSIASLKACFTPETLPNPGVTTVSMSPFGSWVMAKKFALQIGDAPRPETADFIGKTLPVTRPVKISLSGPDEVFDYTLKVGEKAADCTHASQQLHCDIAPLELAQGESYDASLQRFFKGEKVGELGRGTIKTLRALVLTNASVSEGQTIYDKPASFVFEYDKTLDKAEVVLRTKAGEAVETIISTEGKKLLIAPKKELKRNTEFILHLKQVEAVDGSALPDEAVINFTVSGGPKVVNVSVGGISAPTSGTITLTFDQDIANPQDIANLVSISGVSGSVSGSGKQVKIAYSGGLCTDFSITVKKGLKSAADITQTDDWSFSSRTICHTIQTIGYSVRGRAINAFSFGSGGKTILYTGAIHGNEQSARLLMNAWINELEANARSIPAGTRIVVIPSVNPDGVAANTRTNANNVDLNRNFNTSDWKKDVETVEGKPFPGGGGNTPGSEPETQALAAYTSALAPALTMSYHSTASYAIANTCGNSPALADTYSKLTGYRNMTGVLGAFSYQITGTYDDWICEKLGRASVLIELASSSSPEFSRNKAALWAMARS